MSSGPCSVREEPAQRHDLLLASAPGTRNRRQVAVICAGLLLAVGLVFGQTVRHEFVNLDDNLYVYQNPHVAQGLTATGIVWAFAHSHVANWHPLTWTSLMLDCQLYGLHAGGHHLTNLLLHAATAILLALVLRQMTGQFWPSAFVAALFAIHPLRVESVAWVTERKDVLSGLFCMLTLAAYLDYVRHPFSLPRYLTVAALLALGLMAKAMLVTLPLVLLLLDYWPLRRISARLCLDKTSRHGNGGDFAGDVNSMEANLGRSSLPWRVVVEKIPLLALAAGCCALTLSIQGESLAIDEHLSWSWRIGNALVSYVAYVGQFFFPLGLAVLYPRCGADLPLWKPYAALFVLVGITAAALMGSRRRPYLLVGWLWYVGMLTPVIGLVPVGLTSVADRFTYLPQIGLCIAVTYGLSDVLRSWSHGRWWCALASALVLAILMGCAWRQTSFWCDSETLWNHTLACTSQNSAAHNAFGNALIDRGRVDDAITQYREALDIRPSYAAAHFNLGVALAGLGRSDEAIAQYQETIRIKPDDAKAHNNLGNALLGRGQLDEAMAHCQEALRIDPDFAEAHYNLGNAWFVRGRLDEAMTQYRRAVEIRPDYAEACYNLGLALAGRSRFDEAVTQYRRALEIRPDFVEARRDLARILARRPK